MAVIRFLCALVVGLRVRCILSYFSAVEGMGCLAKRDQQELTEQARDRIVRVIRSLADDHVERGVDLARPFRCDSCGLEKSPAGSALYGSYHLCNDCLLDFTLQLASGRVDSVAEFMTKRDDELPPSDLDSHRDRRAVSLPPLQGRDKLMPSNEPC
jgi:hypothetical protein